MRILIILSLLFSIFFGFEEFVGQAETVKIKTQVLKMTGLGGAQRLPPKIKTSALKMTGLAGISRMTKIKTSALKMTGLAGTHVKMKTAALKMTGLGGAERVPPKIKTSTLKMTGLLEDAKRASVIEYRRQPKAIRTFALEMTGTRTVRQVAKPATSIRVETDRRWETEKEVGGRPSRPTRPTPLRARARPRAVQEDDVDSSDIR